MERPALSPSLTCKDVDKSYDYFTRVLGFAGFGKWAGPDGKTMHAAVCLPTPNGLAQLMMGPYDAVVSGEFGDPGDFGKTVKENPDTLGNGVVFFVAVPDVDAYHDFVKKKGALVEEAPTDQFWGDRTMTVRTPDGYYVQFAAPIEGFEPPEGMGEAEGADAVQASAPGAGTIEIPGL